MRWKDKKNGRLIEKVVPKITAKAEGRKKRGRERRREGTRCRQRDERRNWRGGDLCCSAGLSQPAAESHRCMRASCK